MRDSFRFMRVPVARAIVCILLLTSSFAGFAQEAPAKATHGVAVGHIDRSVKPGDDFFRYANGQWLKNTEIPADRATISGGSLLNNLTNKRTATLIEEASKSNSPAGSNARKIADLYNSFMDEAGIEAKGLSPLQPHLKQIAAIRDKRELARAFGKGLRSDVDPLNNTNYHTANLFGLWVSPGFDDPEHYNAYLMQGGLVLPDREYYISDSENMREIRAKYQQYVATLLKLAGFNDSDARATRVIALERALAEKHTTLAENQDVQKANNPWKQAEFATKAPGLDWTEFFRAARLEKQARFIVWQPNAVIGEASLVASTPLDTWKDWLAFHLIAEYAAVLPKAFADESFNFQGKTLAGVPQQRPRWQRGVILVNNLLGDAVGELYAKRYFPPEAKAEAQQMVANIIEAFRKRIDALDWMTPSTKAEAKNKLATLYVGIGYTDKWRDYSAYEVKSGDLLGNIWRAKVFEYNRDLARLGGPVDRKEWFMTPQTVNAVNLPLLNSMNFPAAILQPPFFDPEAPAAFNYGAIGSVIGHEISHSFDSQGASFDSKGRLRNWWTPADLKHFEEVTARLAKQYDAYRPFPDLAVNGQQTLAENIADVAGLAAAYDGYKASLAGKPAPVVDGLTGDQQFFLAFGQAWGAKARPAALRQQVLTDSHSPSEYRADAVRNIDAWYEAFDSKPGEKLYLDQTERVRIW